MRFRYFVYSGLLLAPLLMLAWLWLTMLSPWIYQPPDGLTPISQGSQAVFVYGTLTHAPVRWLVYGRTGEPSPAVLKGFERHGLNLTPRPGAHVDGLRLEVSGEELARLDRYERLGIRYERTRMALASGTQAWVYLRLKD